MSKACNQEIDFFQMEKLRNASSKSSSLRGIQSVVSRINPQLVKAAMAAGQPRSASDETAPRPNGQPSVSSNPSSPTAAAAPPPLPLFNPISRCSPCPAPEMAPLTIFYNGTVAAFDVPRHKAEAIMRMAEVAGQAATRPEDSLLDGSQLEGDLPLARSKSLHRFLEKRKQRLASVSPYNYRKVTASHFC